MSQRMVSSLWWLFGKGLGGSYIEYAWIWLLFSFGQRNHSFFHQQCVKLRGLYFKLGEWILLKTLAALPLLLCDPPLYLLNYAIKILGKSTLNIQEKRRENKHCVCQGKELKKKSNKGTDLLSWLFSSGRLVNSWLRWKELYRPLLLVRVLVWPLGGAIVSQWNGGFLSQVLKSHQNIFP